MKMISRLGMTCVLAAAAVPLLPASHTHAAPSRNVLYTWKFPTSGSRNGWIFAKGVASYDGSSNGFLLAPYTLPASNYAVQARIRTSGPGGIQYILTGFGLTLRGGQYPVEAGAFSSDYEAEDNGAEIYWHGDTIGGLSFSPGTSWHTYTLAVTGGQDILSIDGKQMVHFPITQVIQPTHLGVFSTFYKVKVRNIQVLGLPASTGQATPFPPTEPYALTLSDLPTSQYFDRLMRHYYTDEETARERSVPLSDLHSEGRLDSYGVDYFGTAWGGRLYSSVTAFTGASGALADVQNRVAFITKTYGSNPNFQVLPSDQLGDHSKGLTFSVNQNGHTLIETVIWVVDKTYSGSVTVTVTSDSPIAHDTASQALAFARIVDSRLRTAGA